MCDPDPAEGKAVKKLLLGTTPCPSMISGSSHTPVVNREEWIVHTSLHRTPWLGSKVGAASTAASKTKHRGLRSRRFTSAVAEDHRRPADAAGDGIATHMAARCDQQDYFAASDGPEPRPHIRCGSAKFSCREFGTLSASTAPAPYRRPS